MPALPDARQLWRSRCLLTAMTLLFIAGGAAAQEDNAAKSKPAPQAVISADSVSYDDSLATIIASGNVEITHGERILLADSVRYDQRNDSVAASGNVVIMEPTGEVMFADQVELSDELRSGVIKNIRILMGENGRFAANGARRVDGRKTVMARAVYSPCKICEDEPDRPPLWQIKASTIVHDQDSRDVSYTNARLELLGIPIAYTPYLTHPDPTVERRTGLLVPQFGSNTVFGGYTRVPVFMVYNESIDATVEPIFTAQENTIMALEYRQRFNNGKLELTGSVTKADREAGTIASPVIFPDETRGHFFGEVRFDVSDKWRWGVDYRRATDPTYLDRYEFFGDPGEALESTVFLEGFNRRSYSVANVFGYQETSLTDPVDEPLVAPILDYNYVGEADSVGGRWAFDGNFRAHIRDQGADTRRFSVKSGYRVPFVSDFGLVTAVSASVAADGYHLDQTIVDGLEENNVTVGRVVPRLAVEWRYPLVRGSTGVRQLIEPVAALIAAPNTGNPTEIIEEDSVVVELDDTNLFSEDQIPGLDRADLGQRGVYGLKTGLYGEHGGRMTAFVGQSYRVRNDENAALTSDLRSGRSDYVGRLEVVPNKYFDLLYRFRLTDKDLNLLRSEFGVTMGPPAFRLASDYIFIDSEASDGVFPDRKELSAVVSSQITDFWSMRLHSRRDLTATGGTLEHGGQLTYEDECFRLELDYNRNFTSSVDIEQATTVSVRLVFRSLGDIAAKQAQSR